MQRRRYEIDALRLEREIKAGERRPVYLFYGEEDFLQSAAVSTVADYLLPGGLQDSSCTRAAGSDYSLEEVLDMVDTVALFSQGRLLIVQAAPYFIKGSRLEDAAVQRLLAYHQQKSSDSTIIFCTAEKVSAAKVVKELTSAGAVYHFEPLKWTPLMTWLRERVAVKGKKATTPVLQFLINRVGQDLRRLASELDKLVSYLGEQQTIDEQSILAVTSPGAQANIFALIDAAVYGRTAFALSLLKNLLVLREPPLRILSMLTRQFRLLGEAKELLAAGEDNIAKALSLHSFAAENLMKQVRCTDEARLNRAVELLLRCELDIKRGRIQPVLALETLIVALGVDAPGR
ncbi:MAG TPA: DNA polymerase III subunit delta [Oscillospiraceae bacterium]|nr:DNA polymerase III subunit delta [Oscillospiraceae bacterium]